MKRNDELTKSLVSLIDETLEELEELKKSKFSAAEIKIEGPGDKELAGKPANGELDAKKAEDKEEDKDEKEEKEEKDVEKGVLDEAEEEKVKKEEDEEEDDEEEEKEEKAEKSEEEEDDLQKSEEESQSEDDNLAKSLEAQEELIKSYVDGKFESLEKRIAALTEMIDEIGDKPVDRKGTPANLPILEKSDEIEEETLSKGDVANKLFELKKSGSAIDTSDIIKVETGSDTDVQAIAKKYNL